MHSVSPPNDAQRKGNTRLAWILASVSLAFALGFVAKIVLFSH